MLTKDKLLHIMITNKFNLKKLMYTYFTFKVKVMDNNRPVESASIPLKEIDL